MNQAEVVNAGWAHRDRLGVSLLDSCYFDVRDSHLLESEMLQFNIGSFPGGNGPNAAELIQRKHSRELDAAERYGSEILDFGVNRDNLKINIGIQPPSKKSKREEQMFVNRIEKAEEQKDTMKIRK